MTAPTLLPNRARLTLLQDVADGMVVFSPHQGAVLNNAVFPPANVLPATAQMRAAGWIEVDIREEACTLGAYPYVITDTGRAVLDANGSAASA